MFRVGSVLLLLACAACAAGTESTSAEEPLVRRSSGPAGLYSEPAFPDRPVTGTSLAAADGGSSGISGDLSETDSRTGPYQVGSEPAAIQDDPSSWPESWYTETTSDSDRYPTFNWSGFLQADSGWFIQDDASVEAVGRVGDRTGLRRVRLKAFGNIRRTSAYVVDLDFAASGHPSFRDVALSFHEIPFLQNVNFGYFQQPFSLDAMTSGQELLFLERRLPFAFAPFRQTGLGANGTHLDELIQWSVSVYRFPTDQFGRSVGSSGGYGLATRVTCLPWYRGGGRCLFHMGFGYSVGDPGDNLVQYQTQAGFFVADTSGSAEEDGSDTGVPVFVDTGEIPTNTYSLFNLELGANLGAFHIQSEATFSVVDQRGGPTLGFSGAYAQMGYYLTGESRPYDRETGVFGHARPLRDFELGGYGSGAWEIAAGWSYIDLNDKNIQGGSMHEYSLALNWYFNSLTKLALNYTDAFVDDPVVGPSRAKVVGIRAQFKF